MATWLPNQLNTVFQKIQDKVKVLNERYGKEMKDQDQGLISEINWRAAEQQDVLQKDVVEFKQKFSAKG
jgi:hypothetical protein